ncbi:MAG: trypsin-like peptidase domain-containing protein [Clostridia bacterium]|nr:trypsin-like peptidase domain-containing protein [Clostridia bacterium]
MDKFEGNWQEPNFDAIQPQQPEQPGAAQEPFSQQPEQSGAAQEVFLQQPAAAQSAAPQEPKQPEPETAENATPAGSAPQWQAKPAYSQQEAEKPVQSTFIYGPNSGQQPHSTPAQGAPSQNRAAYEAPTSSVAWNAPNAGSAYGPHTSTGGAQNIPPMQPPKKKKGKGAKIALGLVAVFVIGILGGVIGASLTKGVSSGSGDAVVYQSDTKTSSETDSTGKAKTASTVESVASSTAASVVEVKTSYVQRGSFFGDYVTSGAGSGVVISKNGYIVTNNHVIADAQDITVTLKSGKEYSAKLVGTDEKTDIAVLKIDAGDLTPVTYGDSSAVAVGEQIIVVGNPLGSLGGSVTSGIISATDREIEVENMTMTLLQIDAAVNPGNSGGALFNLNGELIGVVNAKYSSEEVEGLGFAIPINTAKATIEDIIEYGYVKGRAQLGITAVEISDLQTAISAGVTELGVYVYSVNEGSGADKAGLKAGDRIIKIDDKEIDTYATLSKLLDSHSVGDTVSVTISRNGEQKTVDVKLIEYKPTKTQSQSGQQQQQQQQQSNGWQ